MKQVDFGEENKNEEPRIRDVLDNLCWAVPKEKASDLLQTMNAIKGYLVQKISLQKCSSIRSLVSRLLLALWMLPL